MTLTERYAKAATIGYYGMNNFGGLEILEYQYGINDYVIACFNFDGGRQNIARHKLYTTPNGRYYFRKAGTRYYLDEMMRTL